MRGEALLPGDKSVSHRALLLAAVADGSTAIHGLSSSIDVSRTLGCLLALGVPIARATDETLRVEGRGPRGLAGPPVTLDCGDSGTTMRLLAGLLAGQDRAFRLEAHVGLAGRPMERVVAPLTAMGARIRATEGRPPLTGEGGGLHGAEHALRLASAQVGSAILLAALNAEGATTVVYPAPVRDHTERLLAAMGAPVRGGPEAGHRQGHDHAVVALAVQVRPSPERRRPLDLPAVVPQADVGAHAPQGLGHHRQAVRLLDPQLRGALQAGEAAGLGGQHGQQRQLVDGPRHEVAPHRGGDQPPPRRGLEAQIAHWLAALHPPTADGHRGAHGLQDVQDPGAAGVEPHAGQSDVGAGDQGRGGQQEGGAGQVAEGRTVIDGAERVADSFPGFVTALQGLGASVTVAAGLAASAAASAAPAPAAP